MTPTRKKERNINIGGIFWKGERSQWGKGERAANNQNVIIPKAFKVYLFNFKWEKIDTERDARVKCQILNPESGSVTPKHIHSKMKTRQLRWAYGK